mmetsp:Transcript_35700/g.93375  ORF Transcript_35700/g.93375 Transcript_35700/m.93375 type:complete len:217 (-) Transcript_35700:661-1311(-)
MSALDNSQGVVQVNVATGLLVHLAKKRVELAVSHGHTPEKLPHFSLAHGTSALEQLSLHSLWPCGGGSLGGAALQPQQPAVVIDAQLLTTPAQHLARRRGSRRQPLNREVVPLGGDHESVLARVEGAPIEGLIEGLPERGVNSIARTNLAIKANDHNKLLTIDDEPQMGTSQDLLHPHQQGCLHNHRKHGRRQVLQKGGIQEDPPLKQIHPEPQLV